MEWLIIFFLLLIIIGLGVYSYDLRQKVAKKALSSPKASIEIASTSPIVTSALPTATPILTQSTNDVPLHKILADGAYDGLIVVDTTYRILASNQSAQKLFDKNPLEGIHLGDLANLPQLELMVNDALVNEEELFEEQVMFKDRHYRVRTEVFRHNNMPYIRIAMSDITQLVKLNRARRDMVANISHELRTPIANIRLIIDNLFHDQDKPKRRDSISSLRNIARETENLMWLVQEMSDLSMIESGQSIVRMVENPLRQLVDDAIERLGQRIEVNNITVANHVPEHFRVLCDRDLVQRVLVNLIHNAVKWSPPNEVVSVYAENGGDEVTVRVFDNGPGVPTAQVDRIFERFYQVDAARSGGEGTGLGLAICRHIVEAHGGKVWAEGNENGKGGRFFFTLLNAED